MNEISDQNTPAGLLPRRHEFASVILSWRRWWKNAVVATVNQGEVISKRRSESRVTGRYMLMLAMSAGIAVLGLLLSSPAVVIGAMLLSPLMDPIMGLGFALAIGDFAWTKQSAKSLALGSVMAILLCALVVFLSPLQTVTNEIAARTRPNLFDLLVALFSGVAGAYAMIRGREGTVVGVAIATALMPPLAVVGFGLATFNWTVFSGALMLFVTNLVTIALTAFGMAKLYGFRTSLSERHTQLQFVVITVCFVAIAIPLFLTLNKIAWEARSAQKIRSEIADVFAGKSALSNLDINWDSDPIQISATVFTPQLRDDAEGLAASAIERGIERPVNITLIQSRVGPDAKAAQEAQLAGARANAEAAALQRAQSLTERLALLAGVEESEVVVDREHRRALVSAKPLPGLTLAGYRELEGRLTKGEPEWRIALTPPARPMPDVAFAEGKPTEAGLQAIGLIGWAAARLHATVELAGADEEVAQVAAAIEKAGGKVRRVDGGEAGLVATRWGAPD